MIKDSFIFYRSFAEAIDDLPDNEQLLLYRAMKEYALNNKKIELSGTAKTLWKLIEPQISANNRRFETGTKGGRPPKKTASTTEEKTTGYETEKPSVSEEKTTGYETEKPNVNVNVNENVNENDNENVNENDNENVNGVSFSENSQESFEQEHSEPPSKKQELSQVYEDIRNYWNAKKPLPESRNLIINIPPVDAVDVLRTLQNYDEKEIKNAIDNYDFHKHRAGSEWSQAPPYGSLNGFLKTGVARYFDDESMKAQFLIKGAKGGS